MEVLETGDAPDAADSALPSLLAQDLTPGGDPAGDHHVLDPGRLETVQRRHRRKVQAPLWRYLDAAARDYGSRW